MNEENKLKKSFSENLLYVTSYSINAAVLAIFSLDVFLNSQPFPEITSHAQHFMYTSIPIILSESIDFQIYKLGKKKGSELVQKVADYIPAVMASATVAYATIGETVADIIPLYTMSPEHIPAIVLGGVTTYVTSKVLYDSKKEKLETKLE